MTASPTPSWFPSAKVPEAGECALASILTRRASEAPEAPFACFEGGETWTNRDALTVARATAAALRMHGVGPGERVVNWLPNSAAHLRVLLACALLGAVPVPLNPALRGTPLEEALRVVRGRALVTHRRMLDRLHGPAADLCPAVIALGGEPDGSSEVLKADADALPPTVQAQPWDLATLLFTSGTSGRPKAVRVPNAQLWSVAMAHFGFLEPADRVMLTTPLCHIGPLSALIGAILRGASVIVLESFRTQTFWDDARHYGATAVPGIGPSLLHFLRKAPARPDDADNRLRIVNVTRIDAAAREFGRRFGVSVFASFGMTELSVALVSDLDSRVEGTCGRPRDGIEVRIVDAHDIERGPGEIGEMVVRAAHPWVLNDGYEGDAEATVAAWRNGWFHTGDAAWRDADGNFFYSDRLKDVIRRRGENISSLTLEDEVKAHDCVQDAAAVGIASEHGDEEVLVVVSPVAGKTVDPRELIQFLRERLPHFMVPRYLRVLPELPRTASNKVQKAQLRREGLSSDAWDRETSGIVVRQERFGDIS